MKYRLILVILIVAAILAVPASASLKKVYAKAPVFIGETGLDVSSALNGCRQIAWWPAGNTTDSPPGKVLDVGDTTRSFTINPSVFSNYTGKWYSYDKKPSVVVFDVIRPEIDLRIWDLDHDRDVTGQSVPVTTRVTYRIDTNMQPVLNKFLRPDVNNLDTFMEVTLTGPTGNRINSIYTGSAGLGETLVVPFDSTPRVKESPYLWKDGGRWNRTAKGGDGALLYPPGTYTFTATQNLNGMRSYYNATDPAITSGPKTITFVASQLPAATASVTAAVTASTVTSKPAPAATLSEVTTPAPAVSPSGKATWTSTPLPPEIALLALVFACAVSLSLNRGRR